MRRKGGTSDEIASVKRIALSGRIALIEQILFYLAAVAGRDVFGFAVGGWLLFKSLSRYARWTPSEPPAAQISQFAVPNEFDAAVAHNRLQIFLIGTGMSIAAGGIAGVVYHYVLYLL